jgi:hypothetical protein
MLVNSDKFEESLVENKKKTDNKSGKIIGTHEKNNLR